jgi:hypothetical protein
MPVVGRHGLERSIAQMQSAAAEYRSTVERTCPTVTAARLLLWEMDAVPRALTVCAPGDVTRDRDGPSLQELSGCSPAQGRARRLSMQSLGSGRSIRTNESMEAFCFNPDQVCPFGLSAG